MRISSFFSELKRRRVVRVAVVYAVVGFVVIQVADLLVPALLLPDWAFRFVALVVILGFPVALVLAWAFDLTPEGVVRARPYPAEEQEAAEDGAASPMAMARRIAYFGGGVAALGLLIILAFPRTGAGPGAVPEEIPPAEAPSEESTPIIAVLPFANWSLDRANDYFSQGVSEDILLQLSRLDELRVIGRASAAHYRDSEQSAPDIAAALGVDALLVGAVRSDGNRVRITAQLLDGATGEPRWAESYDRELADIFEVQTEVAQSVVDALVATLSPAGQARLSRPPTGSVDAYNFYLMGRHSADRRSVAGLELALDHYRRAIDLDPEFALAHVGTADAYSQLGTWGAMPADSAHAEAREAGRRALDLDGAMAEAWTALGWVEFWHDWDWEAAGGSFRRAIELNPNYATAHHWYSLLLVTLGRFEEAEAAMDRAVELEPLSRIIRTIRGRLYWMSGRLEEAVEEHLTALEIDPGYAVGHMWLGLAYLSQGRTESAVGYLQRGWELDPDGPVLQAGLALSYAVRGERDRALEALGGPGSGPEGQSRAPFWTAVVLGHVNQIDAAFAEMERALLERDGWLTELKVSPLLDPLRSDPRYADLLKEMGLD